MISSKSRSALFTVLAAVMLLTSGTAGVAVAELPGPQDPEEIREDQTTDGEEIVEEFREQMDSLETVQFTRTTESTFDNETTTRTVEVTADLDDEQKRVETLNTTMGSNTTTVWNDTSVVTYFADENSVTEYEVTGTTLLPRLDSLANESIISYEHAGTETVDGQETHVLEGERELNQSDSDAEATVTLYIDTETYFPVQMESEMASEDLEFSSTISYENVTLDEEIPESTFELDLPDDVEDNRNDSMPDRSEYDTYDALASNTTLSVPSAELTEEFSFDSAVVFEDDDYYSVTLTYTDDNESVDVIVYEESLEFNHSDSDKFESIDIGDTTGYLYTSDDFVSVYVEDDQSYTVNGETDEETVIDLAEALLEE